MTADELKSLKKGNFIVTKTGANPMKSKLKLFFEWGIKFEDEFYMKEVENGEVKYASKDKIFRAVEEKFNVKNVDEIEQREKLKKLQDLIEKSNKKIRID